MIHRFYSGQFMQTPVQMNWGRKMTPESYSAGDPTRWRIVAAATACGHSAASRPFGARVEAALWQTGWSLWRAGR